LLCKVSMLDIWNASVVERTRGGDRRSIPCAQDRWTCEAERTVGQGKSVSWRFNVSGLGVRYSAGLVRSSRWPSKRDGRLMAENGSSISSPKAASDETSFATKSNSWRTPSTGAVCHALAAPAARSRLTKVWRRSCTRTECNPNARP